MLRTLPIASGGTMQSQRLVSPAAAGVVRLQPRLRALQPCRRQCFCVRAAMAGAADGGAPDPYQVLGLSPGANSEAVQRSYRRAMNDAKNDKSRVEKIEAAHTSIMMSGLSQRMKGGGEVSKEVKYADRAVYFPWRPRKFVAEARFIQIVGALQLLLAAWALLSSVSAGTQPLVTSALVGVVANVYKQNMIFPAPQSSGGENKNQTFKNLWRGALLTIMATFLGAFLFFTVPDFLKNTITRSPMPTSFYQSESTLLCVGATLFNFIFSAFLR